MAKVTKVERRELEQNAVRKCSKGCYFFSNGGEGCSFYKKGQVEFGQECEYDLQQIRDYVSAFNSGDNTKIKSDAAGITGMIMLQIRRMLEEVNIEGVTILEPMVDAKGQAVYIPDPKWDPESGEEQRMVVAMRIRDHPLIARCVQLSRALGVNLNEFRLTPKSADERAEISGLILSDNAESIDEVMAKRQVIEERFLKAIEQGNEMTKADPIYKQLLSDGDIVE